MPKRKSYADTGGITQRAKKARALSADDALVGANGGSDCAHPGTVNGATKHMLDSQAVWGWLQKWSWGKMSAIDVQKEALNNHSDYQRMLNRIPLSEDHMPSSMQQLAQLGTWGAHPGNVNRELKHWLGEPTMPKAKMVTVPLAIQKPKTGEPMTKDVQFPILLPHEMISHVYHNHPTLFSSLYIGESNEQDTPYKLDEFWTTVEARQDPRLLDHPMKSTLGWKRTYVPLSLHGDAIPVTKIGKAGSKSMDVYSTSGLLGVGTTRALNLYTFGLSQLVK